MAINEIDISILDDIDNLYPVLTKRTYIYEP